MNKSHTSLAWTAILLALALKIWLAAAIPFTGDEAYFYWWGVFPALGYYDHPPMIGWVISMLRVISDHHFVLRLPTIAMTFLIGWGLADLARRFGLVKQSSAMLVAAFYIALPISWIGVPVTTDTPLILALFASGYCFLRAHLAEEATPFRDSRTLALGWWIGAGIALGIAFLSKYFAVVMAIAYAVALLRPKPHHGYSVQQGLTRLFIIVGSVLPFGLLNLYYNATNCWNNVMFNGVNRHEDAAWGIENAAIYLGMMIYLVTPWLIWGVLRGLRNLRSTGGFSNQTAGTSSASRALLTLITVSFLFFFIISLRKSVGLHWVLAFLPFMILAASLWLSREQLAGYLKWTLVFSVLHAIGFGLLLHTALAKHYAPKLDRDIAFLTDVETLGEQVMKDADATTTLMGRAYTPASLLGYHHGRYVPVFGTGKYHARQDDVLVDFKKFDGQSIRVVDKTENGLKGLDAFFTKSQVEPLEIEGRKYWVLKGEGFQFELYRERILAEINRRYYNIPTALPVLSCPFQTRYGF